MEEYKEKGDALFINNKLNKALENYTKALTFENNYKVYLNRCLTHYELKNYKDALSDAINATRLEPTYAKAWGRVGSCLLMLNKKEQATIAFKKAYELDPTNEKFKELSVYVSPFNIKDEITLGKKQRFFLNETEDDTEDETEDELIDTFKNELDSINKYLPKINTIFSSLLSNKELINKLSQTDFQSKMLSYQNKNPMEILQDKEMIQLVRNIMNNVIKK
jgi:tetratricopeptide (TPR) repeat protein